MPMGWKSERVEEGLDIITHFICFQQPLQDYNCQTVFAIVFVLFASCAFGSLDYSFILEVRVKGYDIHFIFHKLESTFKSSFPNFFLYNDLQTMVSWQNNGAIASQNLTQNTLTRSWSDRGRDKLKLKYFAIKSVKKNWLIEWPCWHICKTRIIVCQS